MRGGAAAFVLLAVLLARAAPPERPSERSAEQSAPLREPDGEDAGSDDALREALAAAAAVPEWRELWAGALDVLQRAPEINGTEERVLAQLGTTAFLHCSVRHLRPEHTVSWVRRRDWHILSSGLFLYTNDERFQVLHAEGSDDWVLQIKYVQKRDNGTYLCQVAGAARPVSRQVHVEVAVPEAFILGADEQHVHAGSTLSLVCIIDKSPVAPQYVLWHHNGRMVNYEARGGVAVRTEAAPRAQSTLTIRAAAPPHSGNYSCSAPAAAPAHVLVYVQQGSDKMAATLSRSGEPRAAPHPAPLVMPLGALLATLTLVLLR